MEKFEKRDKLFHQYISLANKIAYKKGKSLPKCVQLDELKSAAYLGLLDAASRYDEAKHNFFPVYARIRILGEINDYLRKCYWGTRGRYFYGWSLDVRVASRSNLKSMSLNEGLMEKKKPDQMEVEDFFNSVVKPLPKLARAILRFYYVNDLTMKEISGIIGMCESRISQIIAHYKKKLQKIWSKKENELFCLLSQNNSLSKNEFRLTFPFKKNGD